MPILARQRNQIHDQPAPTDNYERWKRICSNNENLLNIAEVAKAKIEAFNAAYKIEEDQELTEERARRLLLFHPD